MKTKNINKINNKYYNLILDKPLKGCEDKNIQYIIEVDGTYGIASLEPLTNRDIATIDLSKWEFKPFKEVCKC